MLENKTARKTMQNAKVRWKIPVCSKPRPTTVLYSREIDYSFRQKEKKAAWFATALQSSYY